MHVRCISDAFQALPEAAPEPLRQSFYSGTYSLFAPRRGRREDSEHAKLNRRLSGSGTALELLALCREHLWEFDTVNVVTAVHRMAKVRDGKQAIKEETFRELLKQLRERSGGSRCI